MMGFHRCIQGCLVSLLFAGSALSVNAYVVKSPSSRDTVYCGNEIKIKWKSEKKKGENVLVELFMGDKLAASVGEVPDKESVKWTVPSNCVRSNTYRIKISSSVSKDSSSFGDNFTIKPPSLKIIKPNSGTVWKINYSGGLGPIHWENKGVNGPLQIDLFRRSRLMYAKSTDASSYSIDLSDKSDWLSSTGYQIKLSSKNDLSLFCFSDEFAIQNINSPSSLKEVDLDWLPTEGTSMRYGLQTLKKFVFSTGTFIDERKDTAIIGMNRQYANPRLVTTDESVSQWCCQTLKKVLKDNKIDFDSSQYDVMLSGIVQEFTVTETSTYNAVITIKFKALSKSGDLLWEQEVTGKASNWGTSYKLENYQECYSNAYVETLRNLVSNDTFQNAIRKLKN